MRRESLTQTVGSHSNEGGQPSQTCIKTKEDKRHRVWTRGENLTQTNPKQCPSSGKEAFVANQ